MAKKTPLKDPEAGSNPTPPPSADASPAAVPVAKKAAKARDPKVLVPIVVAAGQVVLGPKGTQYVAGDKVDVPAGLLEKNRKLAE